MIHRKGKLSKALMDRDWPHQVALPAHRCMGHEYLTIHIFCQAENLSLCRRRHTLRQNDIDMTVFCFAERKHADRFQVRFGGELIDPATRPRWPATHSRRRDLFAEERLRNGRCINCGNLEGCGKCAMNKFSQSSPLAPLHAARRYERRSSSEKGSRRATPVIALIPRSLTTAARRAQLQCGHHRQSRSFRRNRELSQPLCRSLGPSAGTIVRIRTHDHQSSLLDNG